MVEDTAAILGEGAAQTPILAPIPLGGGHRGGEFFFLPSDLGELTLQPIISLIVFHPGSDAQALKSSETVLSEVKSIIEEIGREYHLAITKQEVIDRGSLNNFISPYRENRSEELFLVTHTQSNATKRMTLMFQGLAFFKIDLELYRFSDSPFDPLFSLNLINGMRRIKRWKNDPATRVSSYQQLIEKLADDLPYSKLNHIARLIENSHIQGG